MKPFDAQLSEQSNAKLRKHLRVIHIDSPQSKLPKYSNIFGGAIAVDVLPFTHHQVHGILLYSSIIWFFENLPNISFLEQLNLNTKQLANDTNVTGLSQCEWPMSFTAYPMMRCFSSAASFCFLAAHKEIPGWSHKQFSLSQVSSLLCQWGIVTWTSRHYAPRFPNRLYHAA